MTSLIGAVLVVKAKSVQLHDAGLFIEHTHLVIVLVITWNMKCGNMTVFNILHHKKHQSAVRSVKCQTF